MTYQEPDNVKGRIKESYDAIAEAYNTWTKGQSPVRIEMVDRLVALLRRDHRSLDDAIARSEPPPSVTILELGAGAGVPATERLLSSLHPVHVTANDISSSQVALGKTNLARHEDRVDWVEGDMCALDFPDASFDAALAMFSIIHLPLQEQADMLRKLHGWLRPGGYLVFNASAEPMEGLVMEKWLHEKGWMFWSGFGADVTADKVKATGFELVLSEVRPDDVDASFLWVIARKPAQE